MRIALCVATAALLWSAGVGAGAKTVSAEVPFRIILQPSLYRWSGHHWQSARAVREADQVRLRLLFDCPRQPGYDCRPWRAPSARVIVWNGADRPRLVYESGPMRRAYMPNGFADFSLEMHIPGQGSWLGRHSVEFLVQGASGAAVGAYLYPDLTVRSHT